MTTTLDLEATIAAFRANPPFGATVPTQMGINSSADALGGGYTLDGVSFESIWDTLIAGFEHWNQHRTTIASLLSYPTTLAGYPVPQGISSPSFGRLTEYGVPNSANVPASALMLGFDIDDYGIRCDFTSRALRKMTAKQVEATINGVFHSDNRLTTGLILQRIFDPTQTVNESGIPVRGLYNGDEMIPPPYLGNEFNSGATHYWRSGAAVLDSGDVEDAIKTIRAKGHGVDASSQLLIIANPTDSEYVQTWRQGFESRTGGPIAKHSFIPSKTAPAYLQAEHIVGEAVDGNFHGLEVLGSFGPAWLVETAFLPAGYVLVAATSGPNSEKNPVAFREHPVDTYRGLIVEPGGTPWPLVGSVYTRICGTGVAQRGSAVAINVGVGTSYVPPTIRL